jgi:pilus assembly protein CpaB
MSGAAKGRSALTRNDGRQSLRDLSRTVRRHRALLAAALTAAAVATALPTLAPPPAPTVEVVAAVHDLVPGTPLTAGDLVTVALPTAVAPQGALTVTSAAVGRVVAGPVRRGETLTDVRLLGAALLSSAAGLVAAPVRLADPATTALLHTGDRVDVLAAPTEGTATTATTVAGGLSVLAVPTTSSSDADGALVVLACTPLVAARLASAAVHSRLSVTVLGR